MEYVLIDENGEVATWPYSVAKMRQDNPRTSFPANPSFPLTVESGVVHEVTRDARPETSAGEIAVPDAIPALSDGAWRIGWTVRDMTAQEIAAARQPVSYWALQNALDDAGYLATVETLIDNLPDTRDNRRIVRKWRNAAGFITFDHPDTKAMISALASVVEGLDASALWAAAEAEQATAQE